MKKKARALVCLAIVAVCITAHVRHAGAQSVPMRTLVAVGEDARDAAAIERLAVLVDVPIARVGADVEPAALIAGRADTVVLVFSTTARTVTRYRAGEASPSVRSLPLLGPPPSPFQMAFIAAEMLPLPHRPEPFASAPAVRPPPVSLALRAGGLLTGPFAAGGPYPAGSVGLAVWRRPEGARAWLVAGELEGWLGAAKRLRVEAGQRLDLERRGGRLRIGAGRDLPGGLVLIHIEGAVHRTRAALVGHPAANGASEATSTSRIGGAIGLRLELRAHVTDWLDVYFAPILAWALKRNDYRYMGASIARERKCEGGAALGLLVHLGE